MATSDEHAAFCDNVKRRRKELGLTQVQMAERLEMSQPSYTQIESGRFAPGFMLLYRLAAALETTPQNLMPVPASAAH